MSRDPRLYLEDILQSCSKVLQYIAGLNQNQFFQDPKTYDAVLRNLEIIGEAAKNIPDEFRNQHLEIEWRRITGFRDIVAHEYFGINDEIVWDIIQNKIPDLQEQITKILSNL